MRRLRRTNTLSDSVVVLALGSESAPLGLARINLVGRADAPGERIAAATGFASAVVASKQVRADGVVTAGGREAVVHVVGAFQGGVANEAGRAQAVGPVVARVTLRVPATDAWHGARVDAHAVLALLVEGALGVAGALCLDTAALSILLESLGAEAYGGVESDLAEGVGLATAGVGLAGARVLALAVDAGLLVRALGVVGAPAHADALQAVETVLAVTSALALLHAKAVRTDFSATAVLGFSARSNAVPSDTFVATFAFAIRVAAEIVLEAVGQRIASRSSRAAAQHLVVDRSAFGAGTTQILLGRTGINTLTVETYFI